MILRKFFSVLRKAEAIQRRAIAPFCQFVTRRVRMRTPACGLSMILVVARQRCSEGGKPNRLIVKHSSSPSSRLAAACGLGVLHQKMAPSFLRLSAFAFGQKAS